MSYLDSKGIEYDVPVRESKKLNAAKVEALKDPKKRVQDYEIKGKYAKGKGYERYKFKIACFAKKGLRFSALRSFYRKNPAAVGEILSNIFVLASNRVACAPRPARKYKFYKIRAGYRDRWRCETTNREENPFLVPTCSSNPEIRNLYFVISVLLYNLWVIANLFLHKKKPWLAKEPKAFFNAYMQDFFLAILQFYLGHDPPQSEFCRTEELNIMRCIIM
jgi:IS4 transposase